MVTAVSDSEFDKQLSDKPLVAVKYYADWCGTCKLFAPKYKRLSNVERYASILFLEVNAEENEAARKAAGVDNLPFFATFQNGKLMEASATSKEENVTSMLDNLLK